MRSIQNSGWGSVLLSSDDAGTDLCLNECRVKGNVVGSQRGNKCLLCRCRTTIYVSAGRSLVARASPPDLSPRTHWISWYPCPRSVSTACC
jgi:hypothetical protein